MEITTTAQSLTTTSSKGEVEEEVREEDKKILQFLDSMDGYLTLLDSLSSTLRQGWLELASARHSMGSSRISTALFDLKEHPAASVVQVNQSTRTSVDETPTPEPHFTLLKWSSFEDMHQSGDAEVNGGLQKQTSSSNLRHRGFPVQETSRTINESAAVDDQVQKGRSKCLSVFGALVSPKLRSAQVSFETALETLTDIANTRSLMLSAFDQLQQEKEGSN